MVVPPPEPENPSPSRFGASGATSGGGGEDPFYAPYDGRFYAQHRVLGAAYHLGWHAADRYPFPPVRSALDVGAALGQTLGGVLRRYPGARVVAVESPHARPFLEAESARYLPLACYAWHDLREPGGLPDGPFDLAFCLEVAEHLPPAAADRLVEDLTLRSDRIVWSAAIPGQGGDGHLNERPLEYWEERFRARGFAPLHEARHELLSRVDVRAQPWFGRLRIYGREG